MSFPLLAHTKFTLHNTGDRCYAERPAAFPMHVDARGYNITTALDTVDVLQYRAELRLEFKAPSSPGPARAAAIENAERMVARHLYADVVDPVLRAMAHIHAGEIKESCKELQDLLAALEGTLARGGRQ